MIKPNWIKIKQDYFKSDIVEVQEYMRSASGVGTVADRTIDNRTKGWRDEKQELRSKITARAQEKLINNPDIQKQTAYLLKALNNANLKIAELLGTGDRAFSIDDLPKIKAGIELLRLATGQSTSNIGGDKSNPLMVENIVKKIGE